MRRILLGIAVAVCFTSFGFSNTLPSGNCELSITTLSLNDDVPMPTAPATDAFRVSGRLDNCSSTNQIQMSINGIQITSQTPAASAPQFDYVVQSANIALGANKVVLQAVDAAMQPLVKAVVDVNVVSPNTGYTGTVTIWGPTGCAATGGCQQKETVPTTFGVDARVHSTLANVCYMQTYTNGTKLNEQIYSPTVRTTDYHYEVSNASAATDVRLVVQAEDCSRNVIAKTTKYIDVANTQTVFYDEDNYAGWSDAGGYWHTCTVTCTASNAPVNVADSWTDHANHQDALKFLSNSGANSQAFWWVNWTDIPTAPSMTNDPFKYLSEHFYLKASSTSFQSFEINTERKTEFPNAGSGTYYLANMVVQNNSHGIQQWRAYDKYDRSCADGEDYVNPWQGTGLSYTSFDPTHWYEVTIAMHVDVSNSVTTNTPLVYQDAITIKDLTAGSAAVRYGLQYNNVHKAVPLSCVQGTTEHSMHNAMQLNVDSVPHPYNLLLDNWNFTFNQ